MVRVFLMKRKQSNRLKQSIFHRDECRHLKFDGAKAKSELQCLVPLRTSEWRVGTQFLKHYLKSMSKYAEAK